MASQGVRQLAADLVGDAELRTRFRTNPRGAVGAAGYGLNSEELSALDAVDWASMGDDELLVRLRAAANRGTHQTA
jgi:hypothetical protein